MAVDLGYCQARPEMYQLHGDMDGPEYGVQVSLGRGYSFTKQENHCKWLPLVLINAYHSSGQRPGGLRHFYPVHWRLLTVSAILSKVASIATIGMTQVWTYSR
jgi:hypothetical protein